MRMSKMGSNDLRVLIGKRALITTVPDDPEAGSLSAAGRVQYIAVADESFYVSFEGNESNWIKQDRRLGDLEVSS